MSCGCDLRTVPEVGAISQLYHAIESKSRKNPTYSVVVTMHFSKPVEGTPYRFCKYGVAKNVDLRKSGLREDAHVQK